MENICLFDSFDRTDLNYSSHSESTYEFYNRTAIDKFAEIRRLLEKWFSVYEQDEKHELKRRFQTDFDSAFYELFLFNMFLADDYDIKVHPSIPISTKKPDFLITKGEFCAYVEARVVSDISYNASSLFNLKSRIYDKINSLKSNEFFIGLDELNISNTKYPPSLNKINKFIDSTLKKADHRSLRLRYESNANDVFTASYEDDNTKIVISLIPKAFAKIGESAYLIGVYGDDLMNVGIVTPSLNLKKALDDKAKKYGQLDKPFIIAVNALSTWVNNEEDFIAALYGRDSMKFNPSSNIYLSVQNDDGFFLDKKGFRYCRVSGVIFAKVFPVNISDAFVGYYHNPCANNLVNYKQLKLTQYYIKEGKLERLQGLSNSQILGLDK